MNQISSTLWVDGVLKCINFALIRSYLLGVFTQHIIAHIVAWLSRAARLYVLTISFVFKGYEIMGYIWAIIHGQSRVTDYLSTDSLVSHNATTYTIVVI